MAMLHKCALATQHYRKMNDVCGVLLKDKTSNSTALKRKVKECKEL